jgi:hypothetical protein
VAEEHPAMPNVSCSRRSWFLWLVPAALAVGAVAGCRPEQPAQKATLGAPSAQPVSEQRLSEIREKYRQQNPGVVVGPVADVMPDVQLVAITAVPLDQFRVGDAVTFINPDEQLVDTGAVFDIKPHILVVKYDRPGARGRAPQVGDVMVHLPTPRSEGSP